jgi:hypothetical protein
MEYPGCKAGKLKPGLTIFGRSAILQNWAGFVKTHKSSAYVEQIATEFVGHGALTNQFNYVSKLGNAKCQTPLRWLFNTKAKTC